MFSQLPASAGGRRWLFPLLCFMLLLRQNSARLHPHSQSRLRHGWEAFPAYVEEEEETLGYKDSFIKRRPPPSSNPELSAVMETVHSRSPTGAATGRVWLLGTSGVAGGTEELDFKLN